MSTQPSSTRHQRRRAALALTAGVVAIVGVAIPPPAAADPGDPGEPVVLHDDLPKRTDFPARNHPEWPSVVITPDGQRVVYEVGLLDRYTSDYFSSDLDLNTMTPLTGLNGRDALGELSPDGRWFVFEQLSLESAGSTLYATPAAGGETVVLWPGDRAHEVTDFAISPDSSTVFVVAEQNFGPDRTLVDHLFAVPIAGGEPTLVVGEAGLSSRIFDVSPDGANLLVNLRDLRPGRDSLGLHLVPTGGGELLPLDVPIGRARFTPDGGYVVVISHHDRWALSAAPIDGGAGVDLTGDFPALGHAQSFVISPDGTRVIYLADQAVDERFELYSVEVATGRRTRLNARLPRGGDVTWFGISADGRHVAYRADQRTNNVHELFSVPVAGGQPVRLNAPLPPGGDVASSRHKPQIEISPDSAWVYFVADQHRNNRRELFRVPIEGGSPARVSPKLERWSDIRSFTVSPSGDHVAFVGDLDINGVGDLYVVDADGGQTTRMSGPMALGGDVKSLVEWTPNESHLVFVADARTNNQRELFGVRVGN